MNSFPIARAILDKLQVGSKWSYFGKGKCCVEILDVHGIMVTYEKGDGRLHEITAQGFLNVYRLMEDVKL